MKLFHFNDDWFSADAIARIHKHDQPYADKPNFRIVITYKYNRNEVVYDYTEERQRNNDFSTLISAWQHASNEWNRIGVNTYPSTNGPKTVHPVTHGQSAH